MLDLKTVESLAPDQPSLKAAAGLAKPAKWMGLASGAAGALIWGECAGSGANPYRVMADLRDYGSKCTCPSRKFPCKHALALLWLKAEARDPFADADIPDWVTDWLGRRRGTSAGAARPVAPAGAKDLAAASVEEPAAEPDEKALARREAAAARRAADTDRAVAEALDALEQWIGDQLRLGLSGFIDDAIARCRRIAARLVDGKAAALAGRVDELPARLMALPAAERLRGATVELGKLVMLARAFRATPGDAALRRAVAGAETREALLADPLALRVDARWEVVAERVRTRRDGLVSQTSWLLNLDEAGPRFAMLLDFFPASAGKRSAAFTAGDRFRAELVFFPAPHPLRALPLSRSPLADAGPETWPAADEPLATMTQPLLAEPWALELPVLLPPGRIGTDSTGGGWWMQDDAALRLPLAEPVGLPLAATPLSRSAGLWSGGRLTLLAAETPWGRIAVDG